MKFKRTLLAAGTIASVAAPVAAVVACSSSDTKITNIKEQDDLKLSGAASQYKTTVVTDAGSVTDKSFNQSALEAVQTIGLATGVENNYIEPTSESKIEEGYTTAIQSGSKILVLPGFTHMSHVAKVPTTAKAIIVDGWIDNAAKDRTIALSYKVEQAAYMAGYAAADYLINIKHDATPKIGTWAGANAKGVSNYVIGFLRGVEGFNEKNNPKTPVAFAGSNLTLNTGFKAGGGTTVAAKLVSDGADIIMGVAGPQTADGLKAIQGKETKIIGVDVDQSFAYSSDKEKFFTSVEKNIGQSVYDTLADIYSGKSVSWGEFKTGSLDNGWTGIAPTQVEGAEKSITAAQTDEIKKLAKVDIPDDYTDKIAAFNKDDTDDFTKMFVDLGITNITK